jgi:hypothetical protein
MMRNVFKLLLVCVKRKQNVLRPLSLALFLAAFSLQTLRPADLSDPEAFHFEVTGSAWILHTAGHIQSGALPIDLRSDLGVEQNTPTFFGKLIVKPARRHRIIVEGTPFDLNGRQAVTRTITYRGRTFNVSDTVVSNATLTYLFAGYQYDVVSRPVGHLGFEIGGTYLNATGTLRGLQSGIVSTQSQTVGLPLVGAEFRVSPLPGHPILELSGEAKGMALGDYGHYVQGAANLGIRLGPLTFEGGYRIVDADVHETGSNPSGVSPLFRGPVAGVVFRY